MYCIQISNGCGLGNILQVTPAFKYLAKKHGKEKIVVSYQKGKNHEAVRMIFKDYSDRLSLNYQIKPNDRLIRTVTMSPFPSNCKVSEVVYNLQNAGCKNPTKEDRKGFCGYEEVERQHNIVMCNGYCKGVKAKGNDDIWKVKSFANWRELARQFPKEYLNYGYPVSLGRLEERIECTFHSKMTLGQIFGTIKKAKLFISNDTGFYHVANALGVKNIVLFTMTDPKKNYDKNFHEDATIMTAEISCQPCQFKGDMYWVAEHKKCKWKCRDISVDKIIAKAKQLIGE